MSGMRPAALREYQNMATGPEAPHLPAGDGGAGIAGQAERQLGLALKDASGLGRLLASGYREAQTRRVDNELLGVEREFTLWKDNYNKTHQGKDGLAAARDYAVEHARLVKEARKRLDGNSDEIFDGLLRERLDQQGLYALKEGLAYGIRQEQAWNSSQWEGQLASFSQMIQANPEDYERHRSEAAQLLGSWMAKNPGLDARSVQAKLEESGARTRLDTLIAQGNLQGAMRALDEGFFTGATGPGQSEGKGERFQGSGEAAAGPISFQRGAGPLHKGGTISEDLFNPLNLKKPGASGRGREAYEYFASHEDGFAGAWNQLRIYQKRYGLNTPAEMISRWAPESDGNRTDKYIANACRIAGLDPDQKIDMSDPAIAARLIKGMAEQEGPVGARFTAGQIEAALRSKGGHAERYAGAPQAASGSGAGPIPAMDPGNSLPPLLRAQYAQRINGMLRAQKARDEEDFSGQISDYIAKSVDGNIVDMPFDRQTLVDRYGEVKGGQQYLRMELAGNLALDLAAMRGATDQEQLAMLERAAPGPDEPDYAVRREFHERRVRAIAADQKARAEDFPAYLASVEPEIARAEAMLVAQPGPETFRNYQILVASGARSRGHDDAPRISKRAAQGLAAWMNRQDNPAEGAARLQQTLGRQAVELVPQVMGNASPLVNLLAGLENGEDARLIMQAHRAGKDFHKEALAALPPDHVKIADLQREVGELGSDMFQTFNMAGCQAMSKTIYDATANLALQYMLREPGLEYRDAAEKAWSALMGSRYNVGSVNGAPFRIPGDFDPDLVEDGAARAMRNLAMKDINFRAFPNLARETQGRRIRRELLEYGTWITNSDESGLVLMYDRRAVYRKNGQPVEVKWEELVKLARPRDKYESYVREAEAWGQSEAQMIRDAKEAARLRELEEID